jgi:hypothetical protein
MKQFYLLLAVCVGLNTSLYAQNTVFVDASAAQLGYANVFETAANGGAFAFGSGWGVPDLKTVVDTGGNTLTLQPNFNTYADNPGDPYWIDQTTLLGNKIFEGNTFVEEASLAGTALTFAGGVSSFTLDAGYQVVAFIKVFNADFSVLKEETAPITAVGNFTVVYTNVEPADTTVQYGFTVTGLNANPADEAALGSVVVTPPILGVNDNNNINVAVYPNPTASIVNIQAEQQITSILIYNVLGQKVVDASPNKSYFSLDMAQFGAGMYFATVSTDLGSRIIKLIKE